MTGSIKNTIERKKLRLLEVTLQPDAWNALTHISSCLAAKRRRLHNAAPHILQQLPTAEQHAPLLHRPAGVGPEAGKLMEEQHATFDVSGAAELQDLERNLGIIAEDNLTQEEWDTGFAIIAAAAVEAADVPQVLKSALVIF